MSSWLSKLRNHPKVVKDRYAFLGATLITGVIASVWLATLPSRLETPVASEQASDFAETRGAFSQFFSGAKAQLGNAMSGLKASSTEETLPSTEETVATSSNIFIPTLTASTTRKFNTSPVIIETVASPSSLTAEPILIGTTSGATTVTD